MIKRFLTILLVMYTTISEANVSTELKRNENVKQFGLVWGLLKYHHSEVSKGKYDWDNEFVKNVKMVRGIESQDQMNAFLLNFVESFNTNTNSTFNIEPSWITKNDDYRWLDLYKNNDQLYNTLVKLSRNSQISDYYVSYGKLTNIPAFSNEKGFPNFDYKLEEHRLLLLFNFWNAIQYNYVNKYLIDKDWYNQLDVFLNDIRSCSTEFQFESVKAKIFASLNDSHSFYLPNAINDSLLKFKPPFRAQLVNDTLVITSILNKDLFNDSGLKLGDHIVEIKEQPVKQYLDYKLSNMISASNKDVLKKYANFMLFDKEQLIDIKINRQDSGYSMKLRLYEKVQIDGHETLNMPNAITSDFKMLDGDIGYINLKNITDTGIRNAFKDFSETKGIIIDLRNYPKNLDGSDLSKYISTKKSAFVKVLFPLKNRPSLAAFETSTLSAFVDPFKNGTSTSKGYKNPVVLLVNSNTQSRAEYIGMGIQNAENCVTIGSPTAGAVMNVARYKLPDHTTIDFTSMGAFYPDGQGAQKNGLKLDFEVSETTSNFMNDQPLVKAIDFLNSSIKK